MTYLQAISDGLRTEMRRDDRVFVIGEDVGVYGGAFKVTSGFQEEFGPWRVIDAPLAETAIMGGATGAAMMGMRPVAEMQFADFVSCAWDHLVTVAANLQLKMETPVAADLTKLRELSLFVDELANVPPNIRAPYVGSAAFTHKGGQHVHAVQKLASSYEHIDPSLVGNERNISISDMSGQANVIVKTDKLGLKLTKGSPEVAKILAEVKRRLTETS